MHWCTSKGLTARPLALVGYGDEDEEAALPAAEAASRMNRFAELLDRLAYEPGRNNKLRLITAYFREAPDPDRGYALAAMTGALSFKHAKAGLIRDLIAARTDPALFALSYDYVGDLSETVALMWPLPARLTNSPPPPSLGEVVNTLDSLPKKELPAQLAQWLDELDETGRWALLKLVTGALRIGVSARLAKTAAAALGEQGRARGRADLAGACAALRRAVRLAGGPRGQTRQPRSGAVPPGDARACDRGRRFRGPRSERLHRRVEVGRHPRAGGERPRRGPHHRHAALFAHRRGHYRKLPRSAAGAAPARRHRRRAAGAARAARADLQRAAAAAEPEVRDAEADAGFSDPSARLRPARRRRERPSRAAVRTAARQAAKRSSPGSTIRASTCRRRFPSRPGRSSPRRGPIRPAPMPARTPRPSRA